MQLNINIHFNKKFFAVLSVVLLLATFSLVYLKQASGNPVPNHIKSQVNFKAIYPTASGLQIDQNSFKYQSKPETLAFSTDYAGTKIVFNQQAAPPSLASDPQSQPYYPALGIHPYAQFKTKLGFVALTKFWQSGSLKPFGQSAVMAASGTLLIAHSDNSLTNQQWKELFDSLRIAK